MNKVSLSIEDLHQYAKEFDTHVILTENQIPGKLHPRMHAWCLSHHSTIVMDNGDIITSDPSGDELYQCDLELSAKGLARTNKIYPTNSTIISALKSRETSKEASTDDYTNSHQQLRSLIHAAVKKGASDIHLTITPHTMSCDIHFRIHGMIQHYATWKDETAIKVHSVAYNDISQDKIDSFSMILPQDMSFSESFNDIGTIRVRSSNIGIRNAGCKVVYRLLTSSEGSIPEIEALGYSNHQISLLKEIRDYDSGIVLFCGETGSGKTTSLASILSKIDERKTVYSLEDPVEQHISNVIQCPIDTRNSKKSYAHYLRALLRADPDVIMVGEIRDSETAKVAIQGALTGHLILSTLHTCHAINAVTRLSEQGVPADHLATPGLLKMVIAQQLFPHVCPECSRPLTEDERKLAEHLHTDDELDHCRTVDTNIDCPTCKGTGVVRRSVYAEIIKVDQSGRDYIKNNDIQGWHEKLLQSGFQTIARRVKQDIINGKIDALCPKALVPEEEANVMYEQDTEED